MVRRRIWVIATDSAGCYYYRLHLPLTNLNSEKFEVIWRPGDGEHQPGDIVIGQRIAGHNPAWRDMCLNPNITTVYDIDDDLLNIDASNVGPYQLYAPQAGGTAENIQMANVVTVSTPKLAEKLRKLNSNVHFLPNCVARQSVYRLHERPFTVGWAGSMFHGQDMGGFPEQLAAFHGAHPDTRWHFIGADYSGGHVPRSVSPFQTMAGYEQCLNFSVGMAPLMKTPFNEHKSWIKLLEYASKGIPAVASNVGQYPDFIAHGYNGYLMDDIGELAQLLENYTDPTVLAKHSDNVFEVAQSYTIDKLVGAWEEVYAQC